MKLNVIYEDNHIIVVEKPINVPVQADSSGDLDLLTMVKQYVKEKYNKPGDVYIGLVHRLDRTVGWIMVFARTSKAAGRLSELIRERNFGKTYLAVVEGELREDGHLEDYLLKDSRTNLVKVVSGDKKDAKKASLSYTVLSIKDNMTLVKVNLETGRPHQIRVQFSSRGHALIGDGKYGKRTKKATNIALWSHEISFKHPVKDEIMTFKLDMPSFFPWEKF